MQELTFRGFNLPVFPTDTSTPPSRKRSREEEAERSISCSGLVDINTAPPKVLKPHDYTCIPILDVATRLECLVAKYFEWQLVERRVEFPGIQNISDKVSALNFDELREGPFTLPEPLACKLYYLEKQKIVLIKAPSKELDVDGQKCKVRPLHMEEGAQHRLRPIIGISSNGDILDLIQLTSSIDKINRVPKNMVESAINFEAKFYSSLPPDHDTIPLPITLCLLKKESSSSISRLKIIQKRESLDLLKLMKQEILLKFSDKLKIARDIIQAIDYCHNTLNIVFADLKPENILVDLANKKARLTDFGLAFPVGETTTINLLNGTEQTSAPEILADFYSNGASLKQMNQHFPQDPRRVYSRDVWSLGVILSVFLLGSFPNCTYILTQGNHEAQLYRKLSQKILRGLASAEDVEQLMSKFRQQPFTEEYKKITLEMNPIFQNKLKKLFELITKMLSFDPLLRPNTTELLAEFNTLIG